MASINSKMENDIKNLQNEALLKMSKLEEDINRRETENKHSLTICTSVNFIHSEILKLKLIV